MNQTITVLPGEWLSTEQTAKAIGKHPRTVQKMAKAGLLRWKLAERPGIGPGRLYDANDVRKHLPQTAKPAPIEPPHRKRAEARPAGSAGRSEALEALLLQFVQGTQTKLLPPPAPPEPKPWLTLQEAAERSGLTEGFLRRLTDDCQISAVRGGPHGQLRIHRASLDAFSGEASKKAKRAHA